jgi:hypothetical protein
VIDASTCTGECLKSGPWGLAIILLLGIACYFLFRSMSRHLRKVRTQAAEQAQKTATTSNTSTASVEPDGDEQVDN